MILILIINSAVTKKVNYKNHIIGIELSKNDLFLWAYSYMMGHLSYAQEVRLFKLNKLLIDGYKKYKHENDEKEIIMTKNCGGRDIVLMLTDVFQQVVLYAYLIFNVLYRGLPVGSIAIFISTVGQFSGTLSSVFNAYLYLESESFRIQELMDFMDMSSGTVQTGDIIPVFDKNSVIEFRNVSFAYPGTEKSQFVIKRRRKALHRRCKRSGKINLYKTSYKAV